MYGNWYSNWGDTTSWVGGVVPTAEDTAILDANFFKNRSYGYVTTTPNTVLAKDIIVNVHDTNGITFSTNCSIANDFYAVTDLGGTIRLNADIDSSTLEIGNNLYAGRGRADAEGNFTTSSKTSTINIGYFDKYVDTFKSVTVKGDIVITGKNGISTYVNVGAETFTVNGVADLQFNGANLGLCTISADRIDAADRTVTVNLGGIKGVGNLISGNVAKNGAIATSNINITGSATNSWSGDVKNNDVSIFNLSHTGTGTQILTPTAGHFDSVSVSDGVLKLSTNEENGALTVSGGAIGAVGNAAFASAKISGGKLLYSSETFFGGTADMIVISGKLTKETADKIVIDFSGLNAESILDVTYNLLSAGSYEGISIENDADTYFTSSNLQNAYADFGWSGNTLTVTFTSVPEPATYAVIFGALAIAVAAIRRRK